MHANWSTDIDVNRVFFLQTEKTLPKHSNWLRVDKRVKFEAHYLDFQRPEPEREKKVRQFVGPRSIGSSSSWRSNNSSRPQSQKSVRFDDNDDGDDESRGQENQDEAEEKDEEEEDEATKEKLDAEYKWTVLSEVIKKMVTSMITIFQVALIISPPCMCISITCLLAGWWRCHFDL